ncbi:MAG: MFS transporter [Pseudomonadota bacterium]
MRGIKRLPALSQHAPSRYFLLFIVLFTQGFPLGLFFIAIPTWLAANGVAPGLIGGYVGVATLPWSFKFLAGLLIDRYPYLPMGKRRAWLLLSQILIVASLLSSAYAAPAASEVTMLAAIAFAVNAACAFQDAAINGMAVDLVPDDERARANGILIAGEALGTAIGTGLSGILLARIGVDAALGLMALFVVLAVSLLLITRERPGERLLPWTSGVASQETRAHTAQAWGPLLRAVWSAIWRRDSILLAAALMLMGFTYGLYVVIAPVIAINFGGWSDEDFSALNGLASLVAAVAGMLVFGGLVDRIGTRIGGTAGMLNYALIGIVFVLMAPYWDAPSLFVIIIFTAFLTDALMRVATYATAMRLCDLRVAATQYALYLALISVGTIASGVMVGWLDDNGGTTLILLVGSGAGLLGTIAFCAIRAPAQSAEAPRNAF